ncbi:type II secretory pathway component [Rheinheimera sp.]|uniref:type II secretory pathway component n=1 Tax=Rheinheimera sp. TaxID=1869214 RepID=UPI00307E9009
MCPEIYAARQRQGGSALLVAVFVIVLMGLLVAALSRMLQSSTEAVSYEVLGTRAFFAAQTGLEAGLVQLFPVSGAGTYCAVGAGQLTGSATEQTSLSTADLAGCSYRLNCKSARESATPSAVVHYQLSSEGQCVSGAISSQRTVTIEVWQ